MKDIERYIDPNQLFYPGVSFNYATGVCELFGESYMENAYVFYEPLIDWIKEFSKEKKPLIINIKLVYFSTSSSRCILEILDILKNIMNNGGEVSINWFYKKEDPDMLKEIDGLAEEIGIDIKRIVL
jgi:hypothetical protein